MQNPLQSIDLQGVLSLKFPDKGSNLDIQIQNLTYYHYTIREWDGKNKKFMVCFQQSQGGFLPGCPRPRSIHRNISLLIAIQ